MDRVSEFYSKPSSTSSYPIYQNNMKGGFGYKQRGGLYRSPEFTRYLNKLISKINPDELKSRKK